MAIDFKTIENAAHRACLITNFIEVLRHSDSFELCVRTAKGTNHLACGRNEIAGDASQPKEALIEYLTNRVAWNLAIIMREVEAIDGNN